MRSRKSSSDPVSSIKRKPKYDVNSKNKKKRKSKDASDAVDTTVVDELSTPALPFYDLTIQNVVSTFWVGDRVGLRNIQLATQGRLDTTVFPSCVSRALEPLTTNSIFDSGRVLITGAKSEQIALYAGLRFVDKLNRELHTHYQVLNFMVQNMVSSFCLGFKLNIDFFYYEQKCTRFGTAHYDPSKFRGCSYKPKSGLSFVVFQSGKCVLTA
jgi:transcription initiation factor TFIID TATA-box-binding protein